MPDRLAQLFFFFFNFWANEDQAILEGRGKGGKTLAFDASCLPFHELVFEEQVPKGVELVGRQEADNLFRESIFTRKAAKKDN